MAVPQKGFAHLVLEREAPVMELGEVQGPELVQEWGRVREMVLAPAMV